MKMQILQIVFFLLLLISCCSYGKCGPVGSFVPDFCCFKFVQKPIKFRQIRGYFPTSSLCPKPGAIFVTYKGKQLCVKPQDKWVTNYIIQLDITKFNFF
ncbi:C-C motif chemokine 4 homolog [Xenopus laevis]|uniref:Chemokine interleukin-8-like domain-containing protein n=2 Tax=Xenopus laevis TaxID=8355 RepID=A0A974DIF6_XENLA|nr:C-C motif chemokine 4 homolog [Xenopus laevis]OCT92302.1 hypothetical protein XELAEV_18015359mg [Xenopus laevis]